MARTHLELAKVVARSTASPTAPTARPGAPPNPATRESSVVVDGRLGSWPA